MNDEAAPVAVEVVFDRFPASVRGAVVVRGLDADPHQVRMVGASVVEPDALGTQVQAVDVGETTVDIAPHREVVIPFDIPFAGLDPGAYCIVAEVMVDGGERVAGPPDGGRRFTVPKSR
jgi:hypothetical protein